MMTEASQAAIDVEVMQCDPLLYKHAKTGDDDEVYVNPWTLSRIAIPLTFASGGYLNQVYSTPMVYYMYNVLGIETQQYYVYKALITVPILLQICFGFFGECVPIFKKRCKYLLLFGTATAACSLIALAAINSPSYVQVLWLGFAAHCGAQCANAMSYMLVQDHSDKEPKSKRGRLMATCLIVNSAAAALGQIVSLGYNHTLSELNLSWWKNGFSIGQLFLISAAFPVILIPFIIVMEEDDAKASNPVYEFKQLVDCLAQPYVYLPITAMAGIKFLTTDNSAGSALLLDGCDVTEFQYNLMQIGCMVAAWFTNYIYREYLFNWDYRKLYCICICVAIFSKCNDMLGVYMFGETEMPCIMYIGTDTVLADWASYTAIAVHSVLIVLMCQGDRQGKQNIMLTSIITAGWCLMEVATDFYSEWFNVSTSAMEKHNYSGYYHFQLLCVSITLLGLLLLPLIPTTRVAFLRLIQICNKSDKKSYVASTLLLVWWCGAVTFTLIFAAFKSYFLD